MFEVNMVISFLEKLKDEYLNEKLDIEKYRNNIQIKIKEKIEFINLLEKSRDSNYESFTPHEVSWRTKEKIQALEKEKEEMESQLESIGKKYEEYERKLLELNSVIKEAKKLLL